MLLHNKMITIISYRPNIRNYQMSEPKIKIRTIQKPSSSIRIRKKNMTRHDLQSLKDKILKLNSQVPLQQSTIQDLFNKTNEYLEKFSPIRNSLIKIKRIKLFNK